MTSVCCSVCVEDYTKLFRKKTQCPYCDYEACSACVQQYLVSTPETPHCMNCKKAWSRLFLVKTFTDKFVNTTYKRHRENVLLEFEKALMPSTQDDVRRVLDTRKWKQQIIEHLALIGILQRENTNMYINSLDDMILSCNIRHKIHDVQMQIAILQYRIENSSSHSSSSSGPKKTFVRACPANGCKGFLSTRWKCGLCDEYTCSECHELMGENHECKPENVETAKLLAKDTKACPSCASLIHKIDGCDQMFCTNCHTAFSWRTGRIETGRVHNPHYFEYQRNRGNLHREIGDIQCGGLPTIQEVYMASNRSRSIERIYRSLTHFQELDMNRYRDINLMNPNRNLAHRVAFMLGDLSEDDFKRKIQQVDKDLNKRLEIGQVATTLIQVITDLFRKLVDNKNSSEFMYEFEHAREYFNASFLDISKSYKCTVPFMDPYGDMGSIKYHPLRIENKSS